MTLREAEANAFEISPGDYVKISITDTGIGMDHETLKKIFEPFFTTREQEGGTGLGLASAYGIIMKHGGIINACSSPGQGSTFNIYLPSAKANIEKQHKGLRQDLISGSGGILVVDDEPIIVDAASGMLSTLGYTVYEAVNGQEAVDTYMGKKDRIDLVILDIIMPGMSGAQILRKLKEINPGVKVILSSGYGLQGEVRKVMEEGCMGFIQKPYNFRDLSGMIHKILTSSDMRCGQICADGAGNNEIQ
jgi:two-component system, cell cycle sensor histidine kinase and response regulator CckA